MKEPLDNSSPASTAMRPRRQVLVKFLLLLVILLGYFGYLAYEYDVATGGIAALLSWSFFVLCTPVADAGFFRIFTGISELGLAALLLVFAIGKNRIVGNMAFSMLLMVMLTALGLEFFARPKPVPMLVVIAFVLAFLSIYKLQSIKLIPKSTIV